MLIRKGTKLKDYISHGFYYFIYGFVKYVPAPLGDILRYLVLKVFLKKMGKCRIGEGVTIHFPYRLEIEKDVSLNEYCYLDAYGGICIRRGTRIGAHTKILSSEHDFSQIDLSVKFTDLVPGKVVIGENSYIGISAIILKGVRIGKNVIIAAGSVASRNIPDNTIVGGVPATKIGKRE